MGSTEEGVVCRRVSPFQSLTNWAPLWGVFILGVVVGWVWKPQWGTFFLLGLQNRMRLAWTMLPGFGAFQIGFALILLITFQFLKEVWFKSKNYRQHDVEVEEVIEKSLQPPISIEDLKDLCRRIECQNGGPVWQPMMEKSIPGMSYQAWRRDPQNGPTEYRSRTLFEDATPEILRDFFWDDEFRPTWDDMLICARTFEECKETGAFVARWVRKFPFFCSDREYIIGRCIWSTMERSYLCITKGVPWESIPHKNKPRRVELYYSSWFIRAMELMTSNGSKGVSEVLLFHHEEMGIPRELAKLGVRQGMWGAVRKMERGLRQYQAIRKLLPSQLSHSALLAQVSTQVPLQIFEELDLSQLKTLQGRKEGKGNRWKWVIIGAVVLALTLDRGVGSKALLFGLAKRLGRLGRLG